VSKSRELFLLNIGTSKWTNGNTNSYESDVVMKIVSFIDILILP
jgi:hypothetical protein